MSYFNRPILLRKAVESIVEANQFHPDWHLAFADDGSKIPGRPIAEEVLGSLVSKVDFVQTNMTFDDKIEKGLVLGKLANEAILDSDADIGIMLCDDDRLYPDYLKKLSDFFEASPFVHYCYSKVLVANPLKGYDMRTGWVEHRYNGNTEPINPVGKVDASQVAWRLDCCKKHGAWFADSTLEVPGKPWVRDTDKAFFQNLYNHCGLCYPTDFYAQYKGVHDYQLLWHKDAGDAFLRWYNDLLIENAGVLF